MDNTEKDREDTKYEKIQRTLQETTKTHTQKKKQKQKALQLKVVDYTSVFN